jgi:hypothetical protein
MQAGVFDASSTAQSGVGINVNGQVVTPALMLQNGVLAWHFDVPQNSAYLQWGLQIMASATSHYVVTVTVADASDTVLATAKFSGDVPPGTTWDKPVIFDRVKFV